MRLVKEGKDMIETSGDQIKLAVGNGFFIEPISFTVVNDNTKPMKEEIFDPVVAINTFKTEAEVIRLAVDSEYGLYSVVYSQNINGALRVAKAMEAGTVGVNCTSPNISLDMPFGGWKGSGIGREGFRYSLDKLHGDEICVDQDGG